MDSKSFKFFKLILIVLISLIVVFLITGLSINFYQKNTQGLFPMFIATIFFLYSVFINTRVLQLIKNRQRQNNILDDVFTERIIDNKKQKRRLIASIVTNIFLFTILTFFTFSLFFVMNSIVNNSNLEIVRTIVTIIIAIFTLTSIIALVNFILDIKAIRKINRS